MNRTSVQNLRKRVRYHYRGAVDSTLRLTRGCLLGLSCAAWTAASA
ncbi:hypothetical protein [Streptomyces sp. NPDC003697]